MNNDYKIVNWILTNNHPVDWTNINIELERLGISTFGYTALRSYVK